VRPEVSSRTGTLTTSDKNEIPIVETTEAETVVLVEDGGTVILGGLIKDEKSVDHQRIPLLGDIPFLGAFFRSTKNSMKKTELVVFLTPRIITGRRGESVFPSSPAMGGQDEAGYYAQLVAKIQGACQLYPAQPSLRGTVVVEFTVTPSGRLQGKPRVVRGMSRALEDLARRAVLAAAPFPAFGPSIGEQSKTFAISITYE